MQSMPDESIHFSIYSPPFGGLYHYSSDDRDISNNDDYDGFLVHYGYCIDQISRLTMAGRCTAVHCTDIPTGNTGKDGYLDLAGDIIRAHQERGFVFIARHTIWKEPLWVRNRTMTKNLSHRTICDDGVYGGVAAADYLLVFRKKGENKIPVTHPTGLTYYPGECPMPEDILSFKNFEGDQKMNRYSHWIWRRMASSIWDDVRMSHVVDFEGGKEEDDEKHVHPLQLDVIERAVLLRTNEGEKVLTPFMGVGSEVIGSVRHGRLGIGVELKESYFKQATINVPHPKYYTDNSVKVDIPGLSELLEAVV
jgi:DNA modification methylase